MRGSGVLYHLKRYLIPRLRFRPVPLQLISDYSFVEATEDEKLLMLYGVARSPKAARELMQKHKVKTAREVLERLPVRKRESIKSRFKKLLRKIDGHTPGNFYKRGKGSPDVRVDYRWKR